MAKITKAHRRHSHELRSRPYDKPSLALGPAGKVGKLKKKTPLTSEKKDWEDATCSVCLEFPHNAVLLLCSSHEKGCRPYMCSTSYRHSNCLDQFKKAYTKEMSSQHESSAENPSLGWPSCKNSSVMELACPLCRGLVKGYTVVDAAREYLNKKKRNCMQDNCSFVGTYKQLRKHVRIAHPRAKPRKVDPVLEQKWRMLENQRERADVISTIRSSMPGSVVLGDYVIDMNNSDSEGVGNDISGRVLSYILRGQAAWFLGLQRDRGAFMGLEEGRDRLFPLGGASPYLSEEDDDGGSEDMFVYNPRLERRQQRRRQHRSQGRSASGAR